MNLVYLLLFIATCCSVATIGANEEKNAEKIDEELWERMMLRECRKELSFKEGDVGSWVKNGTKLVCAEACHLKLQGYYFENNTINDLGIIKMVHWMSALNTTKMKERENCATTCAGQINMHPEKYATTCHLHQEYEDCLNRCWIEKQANLENSWDRRDFLVDNFCLLEQNLTHSEKINIIKQKDSRVNCLATCYERDLIDEKNLKYNATMFMSLIEVPDNKTMNGILQLCTKTAVGDAKLSANICEVPGNFYRPFHKCLKKNGLKMRQDGLIIEDRPKAKEQEQAHITPR